jgi:predicted transposase/invertase (TIGR01784 family)
MSSNHPHDRFFRSVFAHRELMAEYVNNFLPKALSSRFHLDTLEQQKESYLDKNLNQYFSDVVYTVGYGKSKVTLTLLLEHKSYVPPHPWLQLLQYMVNAYSAQAAKVGRKKLTPVVPIIVYHGKEKWNVRPVSSYFKGVDDLSVVFIPEFKYLLNDLSHYSEEELLAMEGTWAKRAFLALKASQWKKTMEGLQLVFAGITEWEVENSLVDFFHVVVVYLLQSGDKQASKEEIMRAINKIASPARDKVRSAYDQVISWGMEEGMEKGREEERINKSFQVFKKGIPMGLSVADLITLTEVSEETAISWYAMLKENPDAELPKS